MLWSGRFSLCLGLWNRRALVSAAPNPLLPLPPAPAPIPRSYSETKELVQVQEEEED